MQIAVVGGGPAGLRAAEVAAEGGASVTLFDAKASVGRKFLVAGRGGLNLTHAEPAEAFAARYRGPSLPRELWRSILSGFDAGAMREWAAGLGIETFAASTGRVYPREMKAAPLLRRWVRRLRERGVQFELHHRWVDLNPMDDERLRLSFTNVANELRSYDVDAAILALGGGSWPETGSDGAWCSILQKLGVPVSALRPANCGWEVGWPNDLLAVAEGKPLKNVAVHAGGESAAGELMVTRYGLEGGAIYQLAPALRGMERPEITIDFKPNSTVEQLVDKLGKPRLRPLLEAGNRWHLSEAAIAILEHHPQAKSFAETRSLAAAVKACPIRLEQPRPLAEAISSAGGVPWVELDEHLMIRRLPGVFVAGEMIDWEAPTGGYLLQGCFATATHASRAALAWNTRRTT